MINKITGEQGVEIGGREYVLRYDWQALSDVEQAHGGEPNLFDPAIVASVASFGLRKRHPEMTADKIMELSPPLVPFAQAVQAALQWSYFGPDAVPDAQGAKKKSMTTGGFWKRLRRLFRAG
jgi:hypothetical protein